MPDAPVLARRIGALGGIAAVSRQGLDIRVLPPATRFSMRIGSPAAQQRLSLAGLDFPGSINQASICGERILMRLGPDEWMVIASEHDAALQSEIEDALGGNHYALTDISHRNVALEVSGVVARSVINAGCPLDLQQFGPTSSTRTLLGKAEIVLLRLHDTADGGQRYRVECWRSFGRYLYAFLAEAARLETPPRMSA